MSIWIIVEEQEYGPYTREELFHFLTTGELLPETAARIDGSEEVLPLCDALKQTRALFTFDQILVREHESKLIPELDLPTRDAPENVSDLSADPVAEPKSRQASIRTLIAACVGILLSGGFLFWSNQRADRAPGEIVAQMPSVTVSAALVEEQLEPVIDAGRDTMPPIAQSEVALGASGNAEVPVAAPAGHELLRDEAVDITTQIVVGNTVETIPVAPVVEASAPAKTDIELAAFTTAAEPRQSKQATSPTPDRSGTLTESELMNILRDRFAAQPVRTFDDEETWSKERETTFKGSFELQTSLSWNPKVKVLYRVPMTVQKRPTPDADNVVLFCTWAKGALPTAPLKHGEKEDSRSLNNQMRPFSEGLGYTTYTLEIVTDFNDMGNQREAYFYAGPEWVDVVLRAQAEIIKRHHLKKRKLLIYGPSMGGTFAARLAVAMPNAVAGVAIQNTPEVNLPTTKSNTAWFVSVNRGDGGRSANAALANSLKALGTQCIDVVTPPAFMFGAKNGYHSIGGPSRMAAYLFLKGVADLQDAKSQNIFTRWPYVRDRTQPLRIRRNDLQASQQIPVERREYLPTREFVNSVQTMPVPMQTVTMNTDDPSRSVCMVGMPPLGKPKGLITLSYKYQFRDVAQLLNDISYLAERGYLVLAPRMRGNSEQILQTTLDFASRNKPLAQLSCSFIGVGSENEPLWNLLLTQRTIKPAVHVPIDLIPGQLLEQAKWPLGARFDWPVLFLYNEKEFTKAETPADAKEGVLKLDSVKAFVSDLKQRNQIADVRFVPATLKSEEQEAQRYIATAAEFIDASMARRIGTMFK